MFTPLSPLLLLQAARGSLFLLGLAVATTEAAQSHHALIKHGGHLPSVSIGLHHPHHAVHAVHAPAPAPYHAPAYPAPAPVYEPPHVPTYHTVTPAPYKAPPPPPPAYHPKERFQSDKTNL